MLYKLWKWTKHVRIINVCLPTFYFVHFLKKTYCFLFREPMGCSDPGWTTNIHLLHHSKALHTRTCSNRAWSYMYWNVNELIFDFRSIINISLDGFYITVMLSLQHLEGEISQQNVPQVKQLFGCVSLFTQLLNQNTAILKPPLKCSLLLLPLCNLHAPKEIMPQRAAMINRGICWSWWNKPYGASLGLRRLNTTEELGDYPGGCGGTRMMQCELSGETAINRHKLKFFAGAVNHRYDVQHIPERWRHGGKGGNFSRL